MAVVGNVMLDMYPDSNLEIGNLVNVQRNFFLLFEGHQHVNQSYSQRLTLGKEI